MKLKDLVEKHDGIITVDVLRAIEGGVEEVITFSSEDAGAIKDAILNSDVSKFSIESSVTARTATIRVVLVAVEEGE